MIRQHQETIEVRSSRRGMMEITSLVEPVVASSGVRSGLCVVFVRHTSASLVIQENADRSARHDLETFLERLAPEDDPAYTHTLEGSDDMPAHLRSALTSTSESIPVVDGRLALGTWQGLYLFEHRDRRTARSLVIQVMGESKAG